VKTLRLVKEVPLNAAKKLLGKRIGPESVSVILREDTRVLKPNGSLLCVLLRNALSKEALDAAYEPLHSLRTHTTSNRGMYTGGERGTFNKTSGTVTEEGKPLFIQSAVAGYYDRYQRTPYCRETAFTASEVKRWKSVLPLIEEVGKVFHAGAPEQAARQQQAAEACSADFVIHGPSGKRTPYTTLTVNNNVVAANHMDKGDYSRGFGTISVMRRVGRFDGFELVMSRFGVGVDLEEGDVFLFDAHKIHANAPPRNHSEDYERISIVYYLREGMLSCGSAKQERERAALYEDELQHRKLEAR
jgi:hypothetical protein